MSRENMTFPILQGNTEDVLHKVLRENSIRYGKLEELAKKAKQDRRY